MFPHVEPRIRTAVAAALILGLLLAGAGPALAGSAPPTSAPPTRPGESWAAELAREGGDDPGVAAADGGIRLDGATEGTLTLAPRRLSAPTPGLTALLTADSPAGTSATVQARGLADGRWGMWTTTTATTTARLAVPAVDIQVRLLLRRTPSAPSPVIREVWLTALPTTGSSSPSKPTTSATMPTTRTSTTSSPPPTGSTGIPGTTKPTSPPAPPSKVTPTTSATPAPSTTTVAPVVPTTSSATSSATTMPAAPVLAPTPAVPVLAPATADTTSRHGPTTAANPTAPPAGAVVWDGDISNRGADAFLRQAYNVTGRASVTVVDGPPNAIRFTVPGGSARAEIEPRTGTLTEGQTRFFRLTYTLPADFPTSPAGFQLVTQWKNNGEGSPPVELRVENGKFVLGGGSGRPGGSRVFRTDVAPVISTRPVDLVVGIHFSSDPAQGRVDAWVDGKQTVAGFRPPGGTLYPGRDSYWKVGLYRDSALSTTASADLTLAKAGTTYRSVSGG